MGSRGIKILAVDIFSLLSYFGYKCYFIIALNADACMKRSKMSRYIIKMNRRESRIRG